MCLYGVWNPYPYLRIFLPQETAGSKLFLEIFANRNPFLRVFVPQNGWFYHFFAIFAKWDPLLRIFLTKMGPMSKDFCWKSNPFGRHIPVCLNMWVPPPGIHWFENINMSGNMAAPLPLSAFISLAQGVHGPGCMVGTLWLDLGALKQGYSRWEVGHSTLFQLGMFGSDFRSANWDTYLWKRGL